MDVPVSPLGEGFAVFCCCPRPPEGTGEGINPNQWWQDGGATLNSALKVIRHLNHFYKAADHQLKKLVPRSVSKWIRRQ